MEKYHWNAWNASDCFRPSCKNRSSVFEWHKRFKEGRESVRDDEWCRRNKEVNTPVLIGKRVRVRVRYVEVLKEFRKRFRRKRQALFKSGQWHFHQDNAPVHNSIVVTDYLTKMSIKTLSHPPYSPNLALLSMTFGYSLSSETIEEMKEAVTKVIDPITQKDFHGAYQKLL